VPCLSRRPCVFLCVSVCVCVSVCFSPGMQCWAASRGLVLQASASADLAVVLNGARAVPHLHIPCTTERCLAQLDNATAFVPDKNLCKLASLIAARFLGCCPFVPGQMLSLGSAHWVHPAQHR
jgi:hypothetical protein